jgi:hypothetical protein
MYALVESMIQDFGGTCAHFAHYELQEPCSAALMSHGELMDCMAANGSCAASRS